VPRNTDLIITAIGNTSGCANDFTHQLQEFFNTEFSF